MDGPVPLLKCPPELLCQQNGDILFGELHTFKILLNVDFALLHPFIDDLCPNIKVMFLPPHTTSLIQPIYSF